MNETIKKILIKILIFLLLLGGMALFAYMPVFIFNISIEKWSNNAKIIYELICDIIYMILVYFCYRKTINKNFKEYFSNIKENIETSFKYYLIGLIIMIISNLIINIFITNGIAGNEEKVRELLTEYPIYMIFSVAIYAPFIEEMVFRKSIKDIFIKDNKITKYLYILASGLVFGGMHILGNITKPIDLLYLIPYSALGIAFAANYHKTNNIFSTIMMHFMHNSVTLILFFLTGGI